MHTATKTEIRNTRKNCKLRCDCTCSWALWTVQDQFEFVKQKQTGGELIFSFQDSFVVEAQNNKTLHHQEEPWHS